MKKPVALGIALGLTATSGAAPAVVSRESAPPQVGRIARELAGPKVKSLIVFATVGDKSYVATAGTHRTKATQRFRVGSVTKTFTATIVLQLVDEGRLRLADTLEQHLPDVVPRGKEITIRHLLQHRSGLVEYLDYPLPEQTPPIDILRFTGSKPLAFEPGNGWSYSNTNYVALGLVVEQVTGRPYADELERRILQPLGLDATELPRTRRLPDLDDKGILVGAEGGIVSNARDLARFFSSLLSGRVLSTASLAEMKRTVALEGPQPIRDGLGVFSSNVRCGRSWWHGGGILDYSTLVTASEHGDRVGVVSVRGQSSGFPPDYQSDFVCPEFRLSASAARSTLAFLRGNALHAVTADGSARRRLAAAAGEPSWSPDGRKIAFVRSGDLYVVNSADGGQRRLTAEGGDPAWSPHEPKIAFVRDGDLYVVNADGSGLRRLARTAATDGDPVWSPDGRRMAFVSGSDGNSEIYVMNADGSGQRNLTRHPARDEAPAWSPDGSKIAFARKVPFAGVGGSFEIFVMNADGSRQRRLTHYVERDFAPTWSPDGRKVAFERGLGYGGPTGVWSKYDVYVVNPDGSKLTRLAEGGVPQPARLTRAARPRWSPDGRLIAFLRWSSGSYDLWVMNADGSGKTNVWRSAANEGWFAWSPARRK